MDGDPAGYGLLLLRREQEAVTIHPHPEDSVLRRSRQRSHPHQESHRVVQ
jgi:hypothetical protein